MNARVIGVFRSASHTFHKYSEPSITLIKDLGVESDAHFGDTVKHRSRVARDPTQPNLRQVHLIHNELFDELREKGFSVTPGQLGENITTKSVDLLSLPKGTLLRVGESAVVEVTGLRNPCVQIDSFQKGLMNAVLERDEEGRLVRKSGVMGVVINSGDVKVGDDIRVEIPDKPHQPLSPV